MLQSKPLLSFTLSLLLVLTLEGASVMAKGKVSKTGEIRKPDSEGVLFTEVETFFKKHHLAIKEQQEEAGKLRAVKGMKAELATWIDKLGGELRVARQKTKGALSDADSEKLQDVIYLEAFRGALNEINESRFKKEDCEAISNRIKSKYGDNRDSSGGRSGEKDEVGPQGSNEAPPPTEDSISIYAGEALEILRLLCN